MANKKTKSKAKSTAKAKAAPAETSNVTRIKASDAAPAKKSAAKEVIKAVVAKKSTTDTTAKKEGKKRRVSAKPVLTPFLALGRYFKGAWVELRQVRWPTRRATWSMTSAVIIYSAFFVVLILLLDAAFNYLFEFILKK